MFGLGLSLTIIAYLIFFVAIVIYFVIVLKKKYVACDLFEKLLFFLSLFTLMIETWSLVIMNNGFNANFNIDTTISYYITIAILVPLISVLVYSNVMYRKNFTIELNRIGRIGNYMVLPFTILVLCANTVLLFFNMNYYVYYTM